MLLISLTRGHLQRQSMWSLVLALDEISLLCAVMFSAMSEFEQLVGSGRMAVPEIWLEGR